ncbi:MAG: YfhO family protein [Planctomycetota bacterium]|nr:YfhO family protein [Planctomycetota bacterium]
MERDYGSRSRVALPILLLLVLLPFTPVVFAGKSFFLTDTFNFFYPLKKTVIDILEAGALPHWNHLSAGGKPLIGGLQSGAFYPLNFVMIVLPFHRGFPIFFVIHYLLAAWFTFRLARRMGLGPPSAAFAGLVFALSGYLVSMANSISIVMTLTWLPLQILFALDLIDRGRWVDLASLVIVTAFAFLAGAPVTFAYGVGAVMLLIAVGLFRRGRGGEPWRARAIFALVFPVLVFGVCAVQFLPAQDFARYSLRAEGIPYDDAARESLHPLRLATYLSPFLFGNHAVDLPYRFQVAPQIIILITIYLGVVPLLIAPLAFIGTHRKPYFWLGALVVSLLLAFGKHLPLYRLVYEVVPYFDQFRSPFKALGIATFSVAILAGYGLETLLRGEDAARAARAILVSGIAWAIGLGIIVWISFAFYGRIAATEPLAQEAVGTIKDAMLGRALIALAVLSAGTILVAMAARTASTRRIGWFSLLLFAAADLGLCAWLATPTKLDEFYTIPAPLVTSLNLRTSGAPARLYRTPPDEWAGLENLQLEKQVDFYEVRRWLLAPNYGTIFGIEQFDSYESAVLFWHSKLQNFIERAPARERARMVGLFNVEYIISIPRALGRNFYGPPYAFESTFPLNVGTGTEPRTVLRNRLAFPRAYWAPEAVEITDGNEMLRRILEGADFTKQVLVTPPGGGPSSVLHEEQRMLPYDPAWRPTPMENINIGPNNPLPGLVEAASVKYSPNEVEVVVVAPAAGYLVLNDTYHPDWKAWVAGEEREIRRANYLVRAVPVPEGRSTVKFRFEPPSHRLGMAISLFTLLLLAALTAAWIFAQRPWKAPNKGV